MACVGILVSKGHMTVDEMRRCQEQMESAVYATAAYFEKWAIAIATTLLERNLITNAALDELIGPKEEVVPQELFVEGAIVRVRKSSHSTRWRKPHLRTPGYVHGVCGVVERQLGSFPNPEQLAFGGVARGKQPLYLVRFDWSSICDFVAAGDGANMSDAVTVEIYHPWLEGAKEEDLSIQRKLPEKHVDAESSRHSHGHGPDCKRARSEADAGDHHHHHADHVHEERIVVEQHAADSEIPCPLIAQALVAVLSAKGLVSSEELRVQMEKVDMADRNRGEAGRRIVARAWIDASFKDRLLKNGNDACAELGINASNATAPTKLVVMEQTSTTHHLIVCTLCSCYPLAILGMSPDWYKSREYRSRAVREPRAVLREFGTEVPADVQVVVHDSTADCRYLVLPRRPIGTEGWSVEQLQEIVSRDSMLGVSVLKPPAQSP